MLAKALEIAKAKGLSVRTSSLRGTSRTSPIPKVLTHGDNLPSLTEEAINNPEVFPNDQQQMIVDEDRHDTDVRGDFELVPSSSHSLNDGPLSLLVLDNGIKPGEIDANNRPMGPKYDLRKLMPKHKHAGTFDFASSSDERDDSEDEYVPDPGTETEESSNDMAYDDKRSECVTDLLLPESEESDEMIASTTIEIFQTKNTKITRVYDKKQYCIFCEKGFSKITKHWSCSHAKEQSVLEISVEKNKKQKLVLITLL